MLNATFTCPSCGSHHFERSEKGGCCHGYTARGACNFLWDVKDEAKFFAPGPPLSVSPATGTIRR